LISSDAHVCFDVSLSLPIMFFLHQSPLVVQK
jgi:hypothetical protein